MAEFTHRDGNPQLIVVAEPSTFQLPEGLHEVTIRVNSGTLNVNTKSADMTNSPDYTSSNTPEVIKDANKIYLDSDDNAEIIIAL